MENQTSLSADQSFSLSPDIPEYLLKQFEKIKTSNYITDKPTLYILITIYVLMIIVAFFLNIVIFITVLISKSLHKPNIFLSLNLIIANILTTTICTPFTMNSTIIEFWKINELFCKLIPFIQAVTVFIISTTITFISIDRYLMITSLKKNSCRLLRPLSNFSKHKLMVNIVIWILAIMLSSPILVYQKFAKFEVKNLFTIYKCVEEYPHYVRIVYTCLTFVYAFIIPLLTLSYFHYKIKCYLSSNILRFDLTRDKLINNLSKIKTISNQTQQSLFVNINKRNSDANFSNYNNYYSLIDLNLFASCDSHSSPTQVRDFSHFNSELERTRIASIKAGNPRKKLNKSLTLSNNFQFNPGMPMYKLKFDKSNLINNTHHHSMINKSNTITTLSTEAMMNLSKKNCADSFQSLNQSSVNFLSLNHLTLNSNNDSSVNDSSFTSTNLVSSFKPVANGLVRQLTEKKKHQFFTEKPFRPNDQMSPNGSYTLIFRSLSDSNLFDLNQPALHNSFLHGFNQNQQNELTNNNNAKQQNAQRLRSSPTQRPQLSTAPPKDQVSPTFSTKNTNTELDYLKLVNFDYNQRESTIIHLQGANNVLEKARRSEQLKLASFTRFSCFLNRVKRFHYLNRELQRNQKITLILVLGIVVFCISWLPLNIYNLYMDFNYDNTTLQTEEIYLMLAVCHMIAMSSAISNAILYGLLNTNIQKELIKLFKNCLHSKR